MTPKDRRVNALLDRQIDWPVPRECVRLIATEEDCRLVAYQCTAGVWTCGWGETDGVVQGMVWTQDYADERLRQSLVEWGDGVRGMLTAPTSDTELAALVSLAYNIGLAGFRRSSVLRLHNARNKPAAARAFALWNKTRQGQQLVESPGLIARRAREAALYLTPAGDADADMPQAVAPESSLARSPIARGGAVTASVGAITAVAQVAEDAEGAAAAASPVLDAIQQTGAAVQAVLGIPPVVLVGVLLFVVGYGVVRWRWRQRAEGWA